MRVCANSKGVEIEKEETLIVPVEGERRYGNRSSEQPRENRQGVNNTWPYSWQSRFTTRFLFFVSATADEPPIGSVFVRREKRDASNFAPFCSSLSSWRSKFSVLFVSVRYSSIDTSVYYLDFTVDSRSGVTNC